MNPKPFFDTLATFLAGASWAFALVGACVGFYLFFPYGLLSAFVVSFLAALPGLLCVIFFEIALLQRQKLEEMKRHTQLLESINTKLDVRFLSHH
ncbi:hypothetical protein JWV37_06995 [Sulfurospirillum sp. T05]|uniref:Uncharacterized protein n=1 Tax=Sulfurospirillum tamanense TaxID=2813362 RepID=A0ABS2WSC3_9BACT|nr:hypothetical protein [Sulfurospirillum tamanensis]MBN2964521.1 hypothetical protein [Sulfurospirillum tamanensis]